MDDDKKESSPVVYTSPLNDSTTFFAFVGEWMILLVTFSIALFFIPLTPAFTVHSTSASVLNATAHNNFTANLGVAFFVHNTNPLGGTIHYASFNVSLFHRQQTLSTFSLQRETTILQAEFPNVSVTVDEWGSRPSCGFAYLDLRFSVDAARDKLKGRCGEVKFELCSGGSASGSSYGVVAPSCDVYSALVHKVRLGMLMLWILLLLIAAPVPLLLEQFFCF